MTPLLVSVNEAARLLSVSRGTAYRMITAGQLPTIKIRGLTRVSVAALEAWVREQAAQR